MLFRSPCSSYQIFVGNPVYLDNKLPEENDGELASSVTVVDAQAHVILIDSPDCGQGYEGYSEEHSKYDVK